MDNLFENAYFGKPYKTKSGDKALIIKILPHGYYFLKEGGIQGYFVSKDGYHNDVFEENDNMLDIISEWQEEINEKELNELAELEGARAISSFIDKNPSIYEWADKVKDSYKAGYRKAKEE